MSQIQHLLCKHQFPMHVWTPCHFYLPGKSQNTKFDNPFRVSSRSPAPPVSRRCSSSSHSPPPLPTVGKFAELAPQISQRTATMKAQALASAAIFVLGPGAFGGRAQFLFEFREKTVWGGRNRRCGELRGDVQSKDRGAQ